MKTKKRFLSNLTMLLLLFFGTVNAQQKFTIVAAANLKIALDSINTVFKIQNPNINPQITYGASGKFYEQISNGAPFDLFFSADMDYPNQLEKNKMTASKVKMYAVGKLVIWSKKIDPNAKKINSLLDASIRKIAIGNPATAPYGEKAVESLKYYKIYDKVKSKLVFGDNITQATQFVTTGNADIGITALSLVLTPNMQKEGGKYYVIPEKSHSPLEQGCVLLKHGKDNANALKFYNFISSKTAAAILKYYGYDTKTK
ncbi:molybdate transport system substrate-binding protein [Flavobacterium nitrogenifigens]|uniref:Molybdate transport system substrate-binding protein n=2 Tax=Flavobacterium TaxID=237 RepID=A0A7W7IXX2_9FLAO|nr:MULTISPECIES: molybdate ABC transporter substrate-binding protein [Flavobacterium]MBB4802626.1 molybdate transport system substrate-binding protein [Flavobacterium nitrogenifigens]MBB6387584.1 molybdate transport system substrate-binding protein [Flavobacterium notoginsengisoli]